ncbi:MAG TPA: hypothetical protein DCR46_06240 [Cytophagales bacterium]|nr:hypothetical protein [Cytophagales bacterium]
MKNKTKYRKYISIVMPISFLMAFSACNKNEKILYKNEKTAIEGTWYVDKIKFYDLVNGTSEVSNFYFDSKPLVIQNSFDNMDAQFTLYNDGTYSSVSHRLGIYFALSGNQNPATNPNGNKGLWQLIDNGKKIYFDKGIYEFDGNSPRYYSIVKINEDSLLFETSEPKAVFDWAYLYGTVNMRLDFYPLLSNTHCNTGDNTYGGAEFAQAFGPFLGYKDATLDIDITLNPFGIGLRRGITKAFEDIYNPKTFPRFDSCYKANLPTYYNVGFTNGQNLKSSVKTRFSKITFYFSRKPTQQ